MSAESATLHSPVSKSASLAVFESLSSVSVSVCHAAEISAVQ